MENHWPAVLTISAPNPRITRITQSSRICCHNLEDRLKIRWGTGNHAQDFARGSLLLDGFLPLLGHCLLSFKRFGEFLA
jgi:hypothetical protein